MEIVPLNAKYKQLVKVKIQILRYIGLVKKKILQEKEEVLIGHTTKHKTMYRYTVQIPNGLNFKEDFNELTRSVASATLRPEIFNLSDSFDSLFEKHTPTGLCKLVNSTKQVHIGLIKQFWLETCVSCQVFYNILQAPLNNKTWVTCIDFLRSIEATHSKNICRAFVPEKQEHKFGSSMRIQQFLFYFCIVEKELKAVDLNAMIQVIKLAKRMSSSKDMEHFKLANNFLTIANLRRKEVKPVISFQEFFDVLINKL